MANKLQSTDKQSKKFTAAEITERISHHLKYTLGDVNMASLHSNVVNDHKRAFWQATSQALNDIIIDLLNETQLAQAAQKTKCINYLSVEYLMGRLLANNLHNLDLYRQTEQAMENFGISLTDVCEEGADLALGNGGLGRLAACFLDALASLDYNAIGYGIHYQHGLFQQSFVDGHQVESPDMWREFGSPWEICRYESEQIIPAYGYVEHVTQADGSSKPEWRAARKFKGVPWDIPIVGYQSQSVNILRLWECRAIEAFDWQKFNDGDYLNAHQEQVAAETISKVLYPNDDHAAGHELRFLQQYFFCACSIKDIIKRFELQYGTLTTEKANCFANKMAIQLNDTHPTLAILELMRILVDEYQFMWQSAWQLTNRVFAYTNHTLLPEALEKWPVALFEKILPRHLTILYRINEAFLNNEVNKMWPDNEAIRAHLSIIEEGPERRVKMANLCVIASHKVNGVAQIHSALVKEDLFPEFNQLWPDKLTNVTNGITPRRWLKACNPLLSDLLYQSVTGDWAKNLNLLRELASRADDPLFQRDFMAIKHKNKQKLAEEIARLTGIVVDANAIFDVQIKRLHEYKRQHLNLLHILALYRRLLANPDIDMTPRVFIFGAKAAPGYQLAKDIIYAINKVGQKINNDARINGKLKVVFLANYRVSLAEKIIPAADVSEQISTAGKEASGTGNMKLALNGAVTIGTLDGANIEIAEEVGDENIFIFGLTVNEVKALDQQGYNPRTIYQENAEIKACLDWLDTDYFTPGSPGKLASIKHSLLDGGDPYKVLADFQSYSDTQYRLGKAFQNKELWARMAIMNTASMGKFNADRSITDYVNNIWHLTKIKRDA